MKMDVHIHSSFSDGLNTPEEIVKSAIELGYDLIGITDHVRKDSPWVEDFVSEVKRLKQEYESKIRILCCIESKVLDVQGNINIQPRWAKLVDLVFGSFHDIPAVRGFMTEEEIISHKEKALNFWFQGMLKVLESPLVHAIAHPGAILKDYHIEIPREMKEAIALTARMNNKLFEINGKYNVPDIEFLELLKANKVRLIFGSDSHSVSELADFRKMVEKISREVQLSV